MPTATASTSRRARDTGPLFFSPSRKVWIGRVEVGRNAKGKIVYAERSHAKQSELLKLLKDIQPLTSTATVGDWCDRWLKEMSVRPGTRYIREGSVRNHIKPALGHLRISDVSVYQINQAVAAWLTKGMHVNTVKLHQSVLSTCMKAAQSSGLRPDNPAAGAKRLKGQRTEIHPYTHDEVTRIAAEAMGLRTTRILAVVALTGCRIGEALALDVANFNPATGELTIRETQDQQRERGPTKSSNSVRVIDTPAPAVRAILAAIGTRTEGAIFTVENGWRTNHWNARKAQVRVLKRLGIAYRSLHHYRHTVATHMLARGIPVGDVAKYLGDTPEMIVKTYLHATGADCKAALEEMYGK